MQANGSKDLKMASPKKIIHTSGKRRKAIARATLRTGGTGKVRINNIFIDDFQPKIARLKLREPLILAGDLIKSIDIDVNINGGGMIGQAEAARVAIGKALVEHSPELKEVFLNYDRQLLVPDVRLKETRKPNRHGKARAKVQKSYR